VKFIFEKDKNSPTAQELPSPQFLAVVGPGMVGKKQIITQGVFYSLGRESPINSDRFSKVDLG